MVKEVTDVTTTSSAPYTDYKEFNRLTKRQVQHYFNGKTSEQITIDTKSYTINANDNHTITAQITNKHDNVFTVLGNFNE